jgi:hypothetical protein
VTASDLFADPAGFLARLDRFVTNVHSERV